MITQHYDIIILGAGPAGCTCALQLRHSNLKVLLIDKATFPRSKTCGDAVVGRSIKTLVSCCPELMEDFRQFSRKTLINHTRLYINKRKEFDIHWINEAYCCRRIDFDNILINGVRQYAPNVHIVEGFNVDFIEHTEGVVKVGNKSKGQFYTTPLFLGSDGSQSLSSKKLTNTEMSHADHSAAVRAYFKGVEGLHLNRTEVFLLPQFSPGYFWVFPLSHDTANVGFGMLTEKISEDKINLKEYFYEFLKQSPHLKKRFANAEQIDKLEGFGLALGSRRVTMSGDNFILAGDAASLIDPSSGEGISNAIVSGKAAAEIAIQAHAARDFSALFLKKYDERLLKVVGKELRKSTLLLRLSMKMPFIMDWGAWLMGNHFINRVFKRFL